LHFATNFALQAVTNWACGLRAHPLALPAMLGRDWDNRMIGQFFAKVGLETFFGKIGRL